MVATWSLKTVGSWLAIVRMPLLRISDEFDFRLVEGEDRLDEFVAIPLAFKASAKPGVKFALWRHKANPAGTFAIHMQLQQPDVDGCINRIAVALNIPEDSIVWRQSAVPGATPLRETGDPPTAPAASRAYRNLPLALEDG